jgi:hypothetical protein
MPKKDEKKTGRKKVKAAAPARKPARKRAVAKSPSVKVKERFGSKENLIKEVKKLFEKGDIFSDRLNPDKGLDRVSNSKLMRLHAMATTVKEKFGTRKKLIEEYLKLSGGQNAAALQEKLAAVTLGKLLDLYRRAEKLVRKAGAKGSPKIKA